MAIATVDNCLVMAHFSATSGTAAGANVDIVDPGVKVYSSVPVSLRRYTLYNGTSMVTPDVAGIVALCAQAIPPNHNYSHFHR